MTRQRLSAGLSTLLLAATWAGAAPSKALTCVMLSVTSAQERFASAKKGFSATKTLDLTVALTLSPKPDRDHVLELRFTSPDGNLYRSLARPIAAVGRAPGSRILQGYPDPVPELEPIVEPATEASAEATTEAAAETTTEAMAVGSQAKVEVPFPVAGTDIVSSGLYGAWKVEAFLDGAAKPCLKATTFTLKP